MRPTNGKPVILASPLGVMLQGADLRRPRSARITDRDLADRTRSEDNYELATIKRRHIVYRANEPVYDSPQTPRPAHGHRGSAYRTTVSLSVTCSRALTARKKVDLTEATQVQFPVRRTRLPAADRGRRSPAGTNTNPSYEEHYQRDIPVGRNASPPGAPGCSRAVSPATLGCW